MELMPLTASNQTHQILVNPDTTTPPRAGRPGSSTIANRTGGETIASGSHERSVSASITRTLTGYSLQELRQ